MKEYFENSIHKYENICVFNANLIVRPDRCPCIAIVLPEIDISRTSAQQYPPQNSIG
jgi:hypothetical protein